jgi:hypothetical protein
MSTEHDTYDTDYFARLEDFDSVWYDAHESSRHSLSLKPRIRYKECDAEDYFDGIADGISGSY